MSARILLRIEALDRICEENGIGSDSLLAEVINMDRGSIHRARKTGRVGSEFIARAMTYLPIKFSDLFIPDVDADVQVIELRNRLSKVA